MQPSTIIQVPVHCASTIPPAAVRVDDGRSQNGGRYQELDIRFISGQGFCGSIRGRLHSASASVSLNIKCHIPRFPNTSLFTSPSITRSGVSIYFLQPAAHRLLANTSCWTVSRRFLQGGGQLTLLCYFDISS
jgi:hypothetical protein